MEHFKKLNAIDVNKHTEKKGNLTYLSWAWAWAETKKVYPEATYQVYKFDKLPYVYDEKTGYMVFTSVTIEDQTHEMWLPVMDYKNKAMMNATMFDINKTIMRCLTKNLAMFGLGLYIYSGEDLPEQPPKEKETITETHPKIKSALQAITDGNITKQKAIEALKTKFNLTEELQSKILNYES